MRGSRASLGRRRSILSALTDKLLAAAAVERRARRARDGDGERLARTLGFCLADAQNATAFEARRGPAPFSLASVRSAARGALGVAVDALGAAEVPVAAGKGAGVAGARGGSSRERLWLSAESHVFLVIEKRRSSGTLPRALVSERIAAEQNFFTPGRSWANLRTSLAREAQTTLLATFNLRRNSGENTGFQPQTSCVLGALRRIGGGTAARRHAHRYSDAGGSRC